MEFKVGDRVRIRDDLNIHEKYTHFSITKSMLGYGGKIATIKSIHIYTNDFPNYYTIDLDEGEYCWTDGMLELVEKSQEPPTLEELEQRIEKLEKCVMGEQNTLEKSANVSNLEKMTQKSLLSEDERVILRNLDKKWKWIARDMEDNNLHIYTLEPTKVIDCWNVAGLDNYENFYIYNHLFQFIKWNDKEPYNIEELLKGE